MLGHAGSFHAKDVDDGCGHVGASRRNVLVVHHADAVSRGQYAVHNSDSAVEEARADSAYRIVCPVHDEGIMVDVVRIHERA